MERMANGADVLIEWRKDPLDMLIGCLDWQFGNKTRQEIHCEEI